MADSELPQTERRNDALRGLDVLSTGDLVRAIAGDQRVAVDAVNAAGDPIARVVDAVSARLSNGGRLHYIGAGTSGRLGVLDASEMPPTFGTPPELVCAHIAGGDRALRTPAEGAEDDGDAGEREIAGHVYADDAVIGISASGGAAYVTRAIARARALGAFTAAITNSDPSPLGDAADIKIFLDTGPEAVTGSTRLKAGTSQKLALNTISTAVMVRLGKVYENLMVDVVATNEKLKRRASRLVQTLADVSDDEAQMLLRGAGGNVKIAVVMSRRGVDAETAISLLERERGFLRNLL
ncbi:MAG: N-acetylmuramic acid 6-phosphate etherase [Candidatus Eremiobacteraeota bacterium]|nr:N-acetylmuramic acid 6-phosphate etherase [Candidatus Eremiobacteraeota bacterium]